jgi:hypothetical protein
MEGGDETMRASFRFGALILGAAVAATAAVAQAPAEHDVSGVWQAYATVTPPGGGGAGLSEAGAAKVDAFYAQYGDDMPEPGWYCVPAGMPGVMTSTVSYPIEILQTPGRITMLAELEMQIRRVYMDGRPFPPEGYWPTRQGYSIGHWEGETLVIETRYLDEYLTRRWPRTENTRIVERIYRAQRSELNVVRNGFPEENDSDDLLVDEITVYDDGLYKEPQKITMYFQRVSDAEFLEYDCVSSLWEIALEEARDD